MKKFTLTLLLLLAGIPALFAQQTVRNDIFAYLKHEGYAPALDKDSDIEFKIQGILYNIIVKQIENEDYAYVEVLANFGTVTPYDKLMEIANDINQNKFVCKCSVSRNENRNVFTLAMEFVTNSRANTEYQMSHALRPFRHGLRNSTTGSTNNNARRTGTRAIPGGNKKSRSVERQGF